MKKYETFLACVAVILFTLNLSYAIAKLFYYPTTYDYLYFSIMFVSILVWLFYMMSSLKKIIMLWRIKLIIIKLNIIEKQIEKQIDYFK